MYTILVSGTKSFGYINNFLAPNRYLNPFPKIRVDHQIGFRISPMNIWYVYAFNVWALTRGFVRYRTYLNHHHSLFVTKADSRHTGTICGFSFPWFSSYIFISQTFLFNKKWVNYGNESHHIIVANAHHLPICDKICWQNQKYRKMTKSCEFLLFIHCIDRHRIFQSLPL